MSRLDLILGMSNCFALPFAITYEHDSNWGSSSIALLIDPFVIGFEWWP